MTQWFSSKEFDRPSSQRRKKTTSSLSHSKLKITSPLVAEALLNKNSPSKVFIHPGDKILSSNGTSKQCCKHLQCKVLLLGLFERRTAWQGRKA